MDEFETYIKGLTSPATKHFAIQPSDTADLPILPRVIFCQTDGTIMVRDSEGVDLPYTMVSGDRIDFRGVRVLATGTTGSFYGWSLCWGPGSSGRRPRAFTAGGVHAWSRRSRQVSCRPPRC